MRYRMIRMLTAVTISAILLAGCASSAPSAAAGSETGGAEAADASTAGDTPVDEAVTEAQEDSDTAATGNTAAAEEEEEENYETGDAGFDNPRNQDEIGDKELLVVSFGTSYNDSRRMTIGAIEQALEDAFPDYSVRRAFTSDIIIKHVAQRDGVQIDNVETALQRAVDNQVKELVIQPTHMMDGHEYNDLMEQAAQYADAFDKLTVGIPLITSEEDYKAVVQAITEWTAEYDDGKTAIVFMGHGTSADSNEVYQNLQDHLTADGYDNYYIGTVEATPSLDDVLAAVKTGSYERVLLEPLMVVAGDHANNDMAGDEEDSWKSVFEKEGYTVECQLRGLGENEAIRQLYVEHVKSILEQ